MALQNSGMDMLERLVRGTRDRISTNFNEAALPMDSFSAAVVAPSMTVTCAGALNGSRYLNIAAGTTANAQTVIESSTIVDIPSRLNVQVSASQRIINQEFYIELCGVDPVTGQVVEDATSPLNWIALKWDGTVAANAVLMTRSGGQSIYTSATTGLGTTAATGTGPNFIPATTVNLMAMVDRAIAAGYPVNALTAVTATVTANVSIPVPTVRYKLRIRVKNLGTAPASNTDFRVHQIRLADAAQVSVELGSSSVRGAEANAALPVQIVGAPPTTPVSGTVGITGYPTAAAAADAMANPTITHIGSDNMVFNGVTWDREKAPVSTVNVDTSSARTASGTGVSFVNQCSRNLIVHVRASAASGTTPSCVFKLQWSPDNGTTWIDWDTVNLQAAAITGIANVTLKAGPDFTDVAATSKKDVVPRLVRLAWTITGTTPSFTFASWFTSAV